MSDTLMTEHVRQLFARLKAVAQPVIPKRWREGVAVVPVVRLQGVIGSASPLRAGLNLSGIAKALDKAFGMKSAKAVALVINSPGGSPVQSHLIFRRIRQLAQEKEKPVYAIVEDVAASGGYMIACAADEIVCDPSSIVGSIGVVGASFGFTDAMKKLGVERRIYTAGDNKVSLDPFMPEKSEDVARIKMLQREIHEGFMDLVRTRRAGRLAGPEKTLFSGEYWTAKGALGFGLVDSLGDLRSFLRERFGAEVEMPVVASDRTLFGRRIPALSMAGLSLSGQGDVSIASGFADDVISSLETRALWARYGL